MKKRILFVPGALVLIVMALGNPSRTEPPLPDYWPGAAWRDSSPEAQGMDAETLQQLDRHITENLPHIYSLLIVRNGYLVFERYYDGFYRDFLFEVASVTKSITSALVGIALDRRYLKSLDQPALDFFPEYDPADLDSRTPTITLRHVMSMTAGFDWTEETGWRWPAGTGDWMRFALGMPTAHAPGESFIYNTPSAHLLSGVLTRATGMSTLDFAEKYLFQPLSIPTPEWETDPQGYYTGGHALHLRAQDMAKFGYLYLRRGVWNGQQIIPSAWIEDSTRQHSAGGFPEYTGYGYLWWVTAEQGHPAYFAAGYGGQVIEVIPNLDMVVVITSDTGRPHNDNRKLVSEFIIPAVEP